MYARLYAVRAIVPSCCPDSVYRHGRGGGGETLSHLGAEQRQLPLALQLSPQLLAGGRLGGLSIGRVAVTSEGAVAVSVIDDGC